MTVAVVIAGCSKSDLIAKRVDNYPERIDCIVIEELHTQYNENIEILTMDVFHPAITQLEPKWKEFIDSNSYHIYIQARNDSIIEFCSINMNKYYKIYDFRKEKAWPVNVPEKRHRVRQSN